MRNHLIIEASYLRNLIFFCSQIASQAQFITFINCQRRSLICHLLRYADRHCCSYIHSAFNLNKAFHCRYHSTYYGQTKAKSSSFSVSSTTGLVKLILNSSKLFFCNSYSGISHLNTQVNTVFFLYGIYSYIYSTLFSELDSIVYKML